MMATHHLYQRATRQRKTVAMWLLVLDTFEDGEEDTPETKRRRCVGVRPDYNASTWGKMLRSTELGDHTSKTSRLFRRRFRIPHEFVLRLVAVVKEKRWFSSVEVDVAGRQCIPVELKVRWNTCPTRVLVMHDLNCYPRLSCVMCQGTAVPLRGRVFVMHTKIRALLCLKNEDATLKST